MNKNRSQTQEGFTLIELLVVIAIIGMLSSIVLASLNSARAKARDAKRVSDLETIRTALELYANDHNGAYPQANSWTGTCSAFGSAGTSGAGGYIPNLAPTYLPQLPTDPQPTSTGCYIYTSGGGTTDYKIMAYQTVEHAVPQGAPNSRCPSSCSVGSNVWCAETTDLAFYSGTLSSCW